MFSHVTPPQIHLTPTYRRAQRKLAGWLEAGPRDARRAAFGARAAVAALDAVDHTRLARWLAWVCLAERSRGRDDTGVRVEWLDAALGAATREQLRRLPAGDRQVPSVRRLRHSA